MNDNNVSGWYYDLQRNNDLTSIKLLANMTVDNYKTKNVFEPNGAIAVNKNEKGEPTGVITERVEVKEENKYEEGGEWRRLDPTKDSGEDWWDDN